MKNYNPYATIGIVSFFSVTLGLTLFEGGQTVENHVPLFGTLGFQITVALFCGLLILFGYFIGSRMSTDANKEQAAELNPVTDDNLKLKNVSIVNDVSVVLSVIFATLVTVTGIYFW